MVFFKNNSLVSEEIKMVLLAFLDIYIQFDFISLKLQNLCSTWSEFVWLVNKYNFNPRR